MFGSYLAHRLAAPLAAYAAGCNDPAALVPFENDVPRLAALVTRGDEAARRAGLFLLDDAEKYELYSPKMRVAVSSAVAAAMRSIEHCSSTSKRCCQTRSWPSSIGFRWRIPSRSGRRFSTTASSSSWRTC